MKDPASRLVWEASPGTLALQGCPEAFLVAHSGAPTSSGLGLLGGSGPKKLCPQLTWKAVCAGATPWDRPPPGPGPGHRGPGVPEGDSPPWVCGERLACPQLM